MDPNINVETGETTNTRSPRFHQWMAFLVFSTITMGSAVQVKNAASETDTLTSSNRYAVACSAVTFCLSAAAVIAQFFPVSSIVFVGTKIEGVLSIILVVFWAAIVSVSTDAGDNLGCVEDSSNTVQNANLYYFSWAGFVTAIIILVGFLRDAFGLDFVGELRHRAARLQWWAAFLAVSIVVMGSASQAIIRDCQAGEPGGKSDGYCSKTRLAIASGSLGTIFSLLVIATKLIQYTATETFTPFLMEAASSVFLTILSAFNVAYTTSADSPGSAIGNLYYFSWGMFLLAISIASECYGTYMNPPAGINDEEDNGNKQNGGDIEVETFDDAI